MESKGNHQELKPEAAVALTREECADIGRQIQMWTLLLHPQSKLSDREKADQTFVQGDIWIAFGYEAQLLFLHCGMTFTTLGMIRREQIHYVSMDSDAKMRFQRGAFDACCVKCKTKFRTGATEGCKTFIVKNPTAGVQHNGFPFYTFNNIQLLCSEDCLRQLEQSLKAEGKEVKRTEPKPKKIPPPPSEKPSCDDQD